MHTEKKQNNVEPSGLFVIGIFVFIVALFTALKNVGETGDSAAVAIVFAIIAMTLCISGTLIYVNKLNRIDRY